MIEASCHCGNVKITIPDSTDVVTQCNCSACSRFGALWAYFNPQDVSVLCHVEHLGAYCWGDKTITFHHCKTCACVTHYMPTDRGNKQKMAVNFRLVSPAIVDSTSVRYFDDADTWKFIEK